MYLSVAIEIAERGQWRPFVTARRLPKHFAAYEYLSRVGAVGVPTDAHEHTRQMLPLTLVTCLSGDALDRALSALFDMVLPDELTHLLLIAACKRANCPTRVLYWFNETENEHDADGATGTAQRAQT